ncbi:MAG: hypothetical protein U0527_03225 [Candidatus Eisenbacteria bacterium]
MTADCVSPVQVHHDGSFENGIAWHRLGQAPPYYGAFGEAFSLGPGSITCMAIWLTRNTQTFGDPSDLYVWSGGVSGEPGSVVAMVPGVAFENIPVYPDFGLYLEEVSASVTDEFTVGWWGVWPDRLESYFAATDLDGPVGKPWTCVAPDIGYPSGWQDPGPVFGLPITSLGIGVGFLPDTPVATRLMSWARVKVLFDSPTRAR